MTCVILAAKKKDKPFWSTITGILEERFRVLHAYGGTLKADCDNPELVITDVESFDSVRSDHTVIVFRDSLAADPGAMQSRQAVAIVDSGQEGLLGHVAATGLPAITCGLSARDTVTLSSIRTDGAMVNLQRTVTGFDGGPSEPQEIPVELPRGTDQFGLMAALVICLLAGKPFP